MTDGLLFNCKEPAPVLDEFRVDTLPVSVLNIGPMGKHGVRGDVDHSRQSSRSGYSPFPLEVANVCSQLFLRNCKLTVDPFAGWGERAAAMAASGRAYIGFDLSSEAIAYASAYHGISNVLADSRTVDVPLHDGLVTCPPYWKLEKYAAKDGLDRAKTWDAFVQQYTQVLSRFSQQAEVDATYCLMTGDWREQGVYYDLTFQTELIMHRLGFVPFDKVVVSRLNISKVKIMLPQAKRLGYTVKVHEMLSVFKKK